ncbi:MAG: hypothetical protein ACN4E2_04095 [Nitrospinota bacterium]
MNIKSRGKIKAGRYLANRRKVLAIDEEQRLLKSDMQALAKAMDEGLLQSH